MGGGRAERDKGEGTMSKEARFIERIVFDVEPWMKEALDKVRDAYREQGLNFSRADVIRKILTEKLREYGEEETIQE